MAQRSPYQIKKSTIPMAGRGLFAARTLAKGDEIPVPGVLMKRNSEADKCTRFADSYKFRIGSYLLLPLGEAGMINHSSVPNLVKVIRGKVLLLRTLREIVSGEELFFSYSRYAQNRFFANLSKWKTLRPVC